MNSDYVISNYGFVVLKNKLNTDQVNKLRKDLNVTPFTTFGDFKPKYFKIYSETKTHFLLPIYYAINELKLNNYIVNFKESDKVNLIGKDNIILRENQIECFNNCMLEFNKPFGGGIINLTTGSGKTLIAIKIISSINYKTLIILNKIELVNQWKKELQKFIPGIRIGIIQGSKFEYENVDIVLGMLQTITLKKELNQIDFSWAHCLFVDETHCLGSEIFSRIMTKVRPRYTFGLTATLERKDKLEKVIKWHIGDIIYSNINNLSELKQSTEIHLYNYIGKSSVEKLLYDNKTKAVAEMITNIGNDNERSDLIVEILKKLLICNSSRNILVISDRISQLKYIYSKLETGTAGLFIGSLKTDELEKSKEKRIILGTYGLVNEGFNLPKLNCLLFATPRSSVTQALGRIYRKKHEITPIIVDIIDDFSIFKSQQYKRKKIYKESINNYIFVYKNSNEIKEESSEILNEFAFLDI